MLNSWRKSVSQQLQLGCLFHKVKFVIFITLESHDKTCSKIEKTWFLLAEYNLEFQVSILNHYFFVKYDNRQHPTTRCWFNLDFSLISSVGSKKTVEWLKQIQKHSSRGVLSKMIFKHFAKFTGKHLHWSLFLLQLQIPVVFMSILWNV